MVDRYIRLTVIVRSIRTLASTLTFLNNYDIYKIWLFTITLFIQYFFNILLSANRKLIPFYLLLLLLNDIINIVLNVFKTLFSFREIAKYNCYLFFYICDIINKKKEDKIMQGTLSILVVALLVEAIWENIKMERQTGKNKKG